MGDFHVGRLLPTVRVGKSLWTCWKITPIFLVFRHYRERKDGLMGFLTRKQGPGFVIGSDRSVTDAPTNRPPKLCPTDSLVVWTGKGWSDQTMEALSFDTLDDADEYVRANFSTVSGQTSPAKSVSARKPLPHFRRTDEHGKSDRNSEAHRELAGRQREGAVDHYIFRQRCRQDLVGAQEGREYVAFDFRAERRKE